jgi:hypothetical protein
MRELQDNLIFPGLTADVKYYIEQIEIPSGSVSERLRQ